MAVRTPTGRLIVVTFGPRDGLTSLPFGQFRASFLTRSNKSIDMLIGRVRKGVGLTFPNLASTGGMNVAMTTDEETIRNLYKVAGRNRHAGPARGPLRQREPTTFPNLPYIAPDRAISENAHD